MVEQMTIQRFAPTDPIEAVVAAISDDGVAVVERAVTADTIDAVLAEMQPYLDATPTGLDDFTGRRTRRTGSLLARSSASHDLAQHPLALGVCDRTIGENATSYQLHVTQIIDIGPGEPAQMLHRDQWAWDFFPFPQGFEVEISTIWAGVDITEDNGATRVIPGSHRWDPERKGRPAETVPAEMPKGSVLIYTGSVVHGAGENRSTERRTGINIDYCLSWLRQEENQYLACPPDAARDLPIELARLAGYARGAIALGYYGDTRDPIEAVHPDLHLAHGFAPPPPSTPGEVAR